MVKVASTVKRMAVLANMTKEVNFVGVIKVVGRRKAPGLMIEDWGWG